MSDTDDRIHAESVTLAALAEFGMGHDEQQAEAAVLRQWERAGRPDLHVAADAVSRLGVPPVESAAKTEQRAAGLELLGGMTPTDHLDAAFAARELLERLAREHGA